MSTSVDKEVDCSMPTPKEGLLFFKILANIQELKDVDWDKVAVESGYANGATAKKRYQQIKNKLAQAQGNDTKVVDAKKNATGGKKDVGSGTNKTPSKVTKVKGRPKKNAEPKTPTKKGTASSNIESEDAEYLELETPSHGLGDSLDELDIDHNKMEELEANVYGAELTRST